ncbi:MAG TPA: MFS transporter [Pseudonocardiaceae bacterium]
MTQRLTRGTYLGYAVGSIGTAAFGTVPGLLLLYYLTDVLGVTAALAGLVVFAPKAWDVLVNPYLGSLSDRTESRWGPRRPWMLGGALTLPVLFVLMFAGPGSPPGLAALWVAATFLLAATAFGAFQVPYVAQPAEITDDYDERATLMSWRVAFLAVGILVAGAGAPAVVDLAGGGRTGHLWMGVFVAGLLLLGLLGATVGTRRAPTLVRATSEGSLLAALRVARGHRPFLVLLAVFVVQALATGTMLAGVPYYARYTLGETGANTVLFACLVGPAVLVMPLWLRAARRLGKRRGLTLASALFAAGAALLVLGGAVPDVVVFLLVALIGVGYAGMQMFPLAMLPDTIAADAEASGRRRAGVFTGVWTAAETLGLAVGPGLLALLLAIGGYVSSTAGQVVAQPDSALLAVRLGFSLLPAVLVLATLPLVRRYPDPVRREEVAA